MIDPKWAFMGLAENVPAPVVTLMRDIEGDVYQQITVPQYYGVRIRSNVTYEDKGGASGYYVSGRSAHAVTRELEKKMMFNADWDVLLVRHPYKEHTIYCLDC